MILLINVLLTDDVLNHDTYSYQRGFLTYPWTPKYDKVDIFKYSLASYSVIPFNKVLIYCKLDEKYKHREDELRDWIVEHFGHVDTLNFGFQRLEYQKDWQKCYNTFINDNDLIWFCCNHDHVFMDSSIDVLTSGIELLKKVNSSASIYFSHWPELLYKASYDHNERHGQTDIYKNYIGFTLINNNDSIQIINTPLYKRWWFEEDYGNALLPRSDYRLADKDGNPIGYDIRNGRRHILYHYCFVPLREMCRHYDGYGHVQINPNLCPALSIPPGFFDKNIKIRFGYPDNPPDCVNINPEKKYYTILDKNGTDYKILLDELPLFWQNRISNIDVAGPLYNWCLAKRNRAIEDMAKSRMCLDYKFPADYEWYNNFEQLNMRYD